METHRQFRLSSNWTLFLKIFLPTFWAVFFGLIILTTFLVDPEENIFLGNPTARLIGVLFFVLFFIILYITIMQLKRVDIDKDYIYISNYFKTYRYKLIDIKQIKEVDFTLFLVLKVVLHQKGAFGQKMPFILNKPTFDDFLSHHPECHQYFNT